MLVYHSGPATDGYPLSLLYSYCEDTIWNLSHPLKLLPKSLDNGKMIPLLLEST